MFNKIKELKKEFNEVFPTKAIRGEVKDLFIFAIKLALVAFVIGFGISEYRNYNQQLVTQPVLYVPSTGQVIEVPNEVVTQEPPKSEITEFDDMFKVRIFPQGSAPKNEKDALEKIKGVKFNHLNPNITLDEGLSKHYANVDYDIIAYDDRTSNVVVITCSLNSDIEQKIEFDARILPSGYFKIIGAKYYNKRDKTEKQIDMNEFIQILAEILK